MSGFICFCCLTVLTFSSAMAQTDNAGWMAALPDTVKVCRVSIPGTHDSGSAGVRFPMKHYARTQTLSISEQWDAGIRFFDLRPKLEKGDLQIYHGPANCHISFAEALLSLKQKLTENPTEFCIVMTNSAGGGQTAVDMTIEKILLLIPAGMLAEYRADMVVADIRGKILFIHRNTPSASVDVPGTVVRGWPGNGTSRRAQMVSSKGERAVLWAQDYFTSGNNERTAYLDKKWNDIGNLALDLKYTDSNVWCINHTSGYTGIGVSTNIRSCSDYINSRLLDYLRNNNGPIGIVPMDFPPREVIDAIIRCNGLYLQQ